MGVTGKVTDALVKGTETGEEKELADEISEDLGRIESLQEDVTRKEAARVLVEEEASETPSRLGEELSRRASKDPFEKKNKTGNR